MNKTDYSVDGVLRAEKQSTLGKALTARELEICQMVATGMSNKEIALELNISMGTVKCHLHSAFGKRGWKNRTHMSLQLLRTCGVAA